MLSGFRYDELKRARLVRPTILAIVGLSILVGLGNWQWDRRAWKLALLDELARAEATGPKTFDRWIADLGRRASDGVLPAHAVQFEPVRLVGRWLPRPESYVYMPTTRGHGYLVFAWFETSSGEPVLVNRGAVGEGYLARPASDLAQARAAAEITALVRLADPATPFTPDPDPEKRVFYTLPPAVDDIGKRIPARDLYFQAVASKPPSAAPSTAGADQPVAPTIAEIRTRIPNRHLEYALTWWALAGTLVVITAAFLVQRVRAAGAERS